MSYDFSKAVQGAHFRSYGEGTEVRLIGDEDERSRDPQERVADTQLVELAGRHLVISQLTGDGLEVALPVRDRGVDLLAYIDIDHQEKQFVACPIQLKVTTEPRFELSAKYQQISNLLLVYVWRASTKPEIFALTYDQALEVMKRQGYDRTDSWVKGRRYSVAAPGKELRRELESYRTGLGEWRRRILAAGKVRTRKSA